MGSWSVQPRAPEGPTMAILQLPPPHWWGVPTRGYANLEPASGPMKASSGVPPKLQTHPEDRGVARGGCYCRGGWRGWSLHRSTGVSLCRHAVILLVQEMGEKTGAGHGPRARGLHLFSVQDPEDAVCGLVPGLWKGKGPVSGVRDFRLHDPRQVTPLEPHFRHL